MDNIIRQPRPKGLTEQGNLYNKDQITKEDLQLHLIRHYVNSGFMVLCKRINIQDFCNTYDIDTDMVYSFIMGSSKDMVEKMNGGVMEDQIRAIFGEALKASLADRNEALLQYNRLLASQGDGYKAFISGETNKALKIMLESTKGLMDLIKTSTQGPSTILNLNQTQQTNQVQANSLTVEKALLLLNDDKAIKQPDLLDDPESKKALFDKYDIDETPEVQANKQSGIDTTKEGLKFKNIAKLSDSILNDADKPSHQDRRAVQEDVDLNNDDNI